MIIGLIKEGKNPPDKRTPLTPVDCKRLLNQYKGIEILVQRSPHRAYKDEEYEQEGLVLTDSLQKADCIFGVKEVDIDDLLPDKTYFFFSHTIKEQAYNQKLLQTVLKRNIRLVDYECLKKENSRMLGFGRYAGIVGAYNGLLTYGKRSNLYDLKPAHLCTGKNDLMDELKKVRLPKHFRIAITGMGRVAGGAMEILDALQLRKLSPVQYLMDTIESPSYVQLSVVDYFRKPDGSQFERSEVFHHPERFVKNFLPYAEKTDLYISCHFWDSQGPPIFSVEELQSTDFRISTIADISCDIAGPIPTTLRASTIADPIYEVDKQTLKEVDSVGKNTLSVMAVDNLPCELPRDASADFSRELLNQVFPILLGEDSEQILARATIAKAGKLTEDYQYLQDYAEGN